MVIRWKFDIDWQKIRYKTVKDKLKIGFYQTHKFYILPLMPEKFRNRVVFLPEKCEPEKIFKKQKIRLQKLERDWKKIELKFFNKVKTYFPDIEKVKIIILPSLYGPVGSYDLDKNKILLFPRYDRKVEDIQKLLINSLVHYFLFNSKNLDRNKKLWIKKQQQSIYYQKLILPNSKSRDMINILNREFVGKYALASNVYLKKIGCYFMEKFSKPKNLTKNESIVFDLFINNQEKIITFDQIADVIWTNTQDEKYSEYAITKLVERLKKKLPKNIIHSQRGVGYVYYI